MRALSVFLVFALLLPIAEATKCHVEVHATTSECETGSDYCATTHRDVDVSWSKKQPLRHCGCFVDEKDKDERGCGKPTKQYRDDVGKVVVATVKLLGKMKVSLQF